MSADTHTIYATITRSHGEPTETVNLTCNCGVKAHYRRRHSDSPVKGSAGFPVSTGNQSREMAAQARQAHARAGVLV